MYAPTVGMGAQRMLQIEIARERDYCTVFDLDTAFLNATLKEDVYISLPPCWQEQEGKRTVKKLEKASYVKL